MSLSRNNVLINIDNIKVSSNEYLVKYTLWRNLKKLLENDAALDELFQNVSKSIRISAYKEGKRYAFGDIVWYRFKDRKKVAILRSLSPENATCPEDGFDKDQEKTFRDNGWENLSLDAQLKDTDILERVDNAVYQAIKLHQDGQHPLGSLDERNLDRTFMRADLSNANRKRGQFFFPYVTGFLPKDDSGTIINGAYRYYDNGLLEYDIIYRLGYVGKVQHDGRMVEALSCNNLEFSVDDSQDRRYFYNPKAYSIFANESSYYSQVGNMVNLNRNDYVNTYSATLRFPIPFMRNDYMIFSSSMMSQTSTASDKADVPRIVPGSNAITFCKKKMDQVTALLVTYPDGNNWMNQGYNARNGGLASNSFRCRIVGRARERDE